MTKRGHGGVHPPEGNPVPGVVRFGCGLVAEMHTVATELWKRIRDTKDVE